MRIIGLHGLPQSGKDTIADHLCAKQNYARIAFAGPLKDGLIAMFGLTREDFGPGRKEFTHRLIGRSPRRLMQTLGTEWGRTLIDSEIWIRIAAERMRHMARYASGIVVTDVRYENEAAFVRDHRYGEIWHVLRGHQPRDMSHSSNAAVAFVAELDSVIFNSGTIETLHAEVDKMLNERRIDEARPAAQRAVSGTGVVS